MADYMKTFLSRRKFLQGLSTVCAATAINGLFGIRVAESVVLTNRRGGKGRLKAYIRSGRNIHGLSKAALAHCHNYVYATERAAEISIAHLGDYAEVKTWYITLERYIALFVKPRTFKATIKDFHAFQAESWPQFPHRPKPDHYRPFRPVRPWR